ncbi:MAG: hypothetical protein KY442_04875 [Proteobacteria bacterium]|nr:hypothetical protein [Pseudomonadota bacterium]
MARNIENDSGGRGNRWSPAIWGSAVFLLLLPLIAMQFTGEVDWTASDFLVMGVLLAIACGSYELATRISGSTAYRAASGLAIVTAFLTVWVNLAVGMLGSEDNPVNLSFGGVLAIGAIGTLIARFQSRRMARAMQATALAQAAMTVFALVAGYADVVPHVAVFILPWLLSAQLFRKAARERVGADAVG